MKLLLGCGSARDRRVWLPGDPDDALDWGGGLVRLDHNADHRPDVVHDLDVLPWPFDDDTFERIDAYEVLEHLGQQGDYRSFFAHFTEVWRILRPGGHLVATCPAWNSPWAFGDPSHRRVITTGSLVFLDQAEYVKQVGKTPMSDFRFCYEADLQTVFTEERDGQLTFVLQAVKPSRWARR